MNAQSFDGMTRERCPGGCNAARCVISGRPVCSHPCKGGLQDAIARADISAVQRFQAARITLAMGPIEGVGPGEAASIRLGER
jgi:hypothetical protein